MEKKKIYQILTGNSEDEYYTFFTPKFKDDEFLVCKDIIIRLFVERTVINKKIKADYASEIITEQSFALSDGVVIKSFDIEDVGWINRAQIEAEEQLKDRELEVYREIIPKLLTRQNQTYPISETPVQTQGNKNLFIQ
jgi:hypothetical protein